MRPEVPERSILERILRARTHLVLDDPFFGNLIYRLEFVEDYSADTAWVDGVSLGYNPNYIAEISDAQLKGLLCHEILHVANGHCWRRGWRDHELWNEACDYTINHIVLDAGYVLPKGGLLNKDFKGKPAEIIYDLLPKPSGNSKPQAKPGQGNGQGAESQNGSDSAKKDDKGEAAQGGSSSQEGKDPGQQPPQPGAQDGSNPQGKDAKAQGGAGEDPNQDSKGGSKGKGNGKGSKGSGKPSKTSGGNSAAGDGSQSAPGRKQSGAGDSANGSDPTATTPPVTARPSGARAPGEVRDAPAGTDRKKLETDWKTAVNLAAQIARGRGNLPGSISEMVGEALKPVVDWRSVLRLFIQQAWAAVDYSWRMPSASYLPLGLYLPKLASESMPAMGIGFDTSMSITGRLLEAFKTEVRAIVEELMPDECYIAYCDTIVQKVVRYVAGDPVKFDSIPGRGGTDFRPVFEWLKKEQLNLVCLVYLTDMEGVYPKEDPGFPVLWVSPPTRITPPWGEHVEMRD